MIYCNRLPGYHNFSLPFDSAEVFLRKLGHICSGPFTAHVEQCYAKTGLTQLLDLLEPCRIERIAHKACRKAAGHVHHYCMSAAIPGVPSAASKHIQSSRPTLDGIHCHLASSFAMFGRSLGLYRCAYANFRQLCHHAERASRKNGREAGYAAVTLESRLFGPIGAMLFAVLGTFTARNNAQQQLIAAGERLERAFEHVTTSYEEAIEDLHGRAFDLLAWHHDQ